jgi:predicted enzyme related to lactoylglutathione lyase
MAPGSSRGLVLRVDDIEAAAAELEAKGIRSEVGIESAPWGRYVQIGDPDGNGLILQEDAA